MANSQEQIDAAQQEPVVLPCCGFTDARAVMWNFYNKVVQCHNCGQVYTSPPAQRKPLTDEVIWLEYQRFWPFHPAEEPTLAKDIVKFARAIEAAHGIGEKK